VGFPRDAVIADELLDAGLSDGLAADQVDARLADDFHAFTSMVGGLYEKRAGRGAAEVAARGDPLADKNAVLAPWAEGGQVGQVCACLKCAPLLSVAAGKQDAQDARGRATSSCASYGSGARIPDRAGRADGARADEAIGPTNGSTRRVRSIEWTIFL